MIKNFNCFSTGIIILLTVAKISTNDGTDTRHIPLKNFTREYRYGFAFQDTPVLKSHKLPKKPANVKLPAAPLVVVIPKPPKTPNLFKRLAEIFKFRKYSHIREQARVTNFVDSLIADSIYASEENVKFLIQNLNDTLYQNVDSLRALVKRLRKSEQDLYADQHYLDSSQSDLDRKFGTINDFVRISKGQYASREVSDKDLHSLASRIFPIIDVDMDIKALTTKMNRINLLKNIEDSLHIPRTGFDTATNQDRNYMVRTKNKIDVYGFYNCLNATPIDINKLKNINTFIYNSIFINSQTGDIKFLNGWDTSAAVSQAQNAGCAVALTFTIEGERGLYDFLNNRNAQYNFITSAIYLMKFRNAGAINISFNNISAEQSNALNYFIGSLYRKIKEDDNRFKLFLTVPATIIGNNYDIPLLNGISDRVIIDFSRNYGPTGIPMKSFMRLPEDVQLTPMASLKRLSGVISYFIKSRLSPDKIVVCLPYGGEKWETVKGYENRLIDYIPYSTIRNSYPFASYRNYLVDSTGTAEMDSLNYNKDTIRRIFYENEFTIGKKYDLILKNGLGGVAVNGLGDDFGYMGLWDEMSFAFAIPDTIYDRSMVVKRLQKDTTLGWFDKVSRLFTLYSYILQNPCEVCFENVKDDTERDKIHQYLIDLDIDSQMKMANASLVAKHQDTFRSHFEYVSSKMTNLLKAINILLLLLLLLLGFVYIKKVKYQGDRWIWKKKMEGILIGTSVLFILFLFSLVFASDFFPFIGTQVSKNAGYSKDYALAMRAGEAEQVSTGYCEQDPSSKCVNMPLHKLLVIVILMLGVGALITRYLVLPQLKKYDVP